VAKPAPLLGEHNYDVFSGWLGYSKVELAGLRRTGII
jgi:crotonobetainyl-CoA:carnitine CoA-transferase CaiB-like acyl-CoA transferase